VVDRLADQKYTLENLLEFIRKYNSDEGVKRIENDFNSLLSEYNKLSETETGKANPKNNNVKIFEGGKKLVMTKDQFDSIKNKIASIRNSYTNNSK
jgi:ElaB/YqjD/DUF883 family membrane-anchored ribosome-binding protein